MAFSKIPVNTFERLAINAGMVLTDFDPSGKTYVEDNILGATTGGVTFTATPSFTDFGEDIDNCPKNTMELKQLDAWECLLSGTLVTTDSKTAKKLVGLADENGGKVVPRNVVKQTDFDDIWFVGDLSDGGYCAIRLINALSTGGFSLQSTDKGKAQFAFEFTGHYSIDSQDTVPFELYYVAPATGASE